MAGVKATPQDANAAWKTNFAGATAKYQRGVQAFQGDPTKLAAAAADRWAANVQAAKPTFVAKLQAVPAGYWQSRAATVGANNLAAGATKGADRQLAFMTNFLGQLGQVVQSLPARGSYAENMTRQRAFADALHAKKGQF